MPQAPPAAKPFLGDLHAFRGFAIVNIMLVHTLPIYLLILRNRYGAGYAYSELHHISEVLFHGSTIYFTFISGAIFSAVLARSTWQRYFRNKFLYVVLPYIAMSLLFTVVKWDFGNGVAVRTDAGIWTSWIRNIVLGRAVFTYWYMPVILTLFCLTPVIAWIARSRFAGWALPVLALAPLIISRTGAEFSIQTVIYFAGAYTIGMWVGRDYQATLDRIASWRAELWTTVAVTSVAIMALLEFDWNWFGGVSVLETLFYAQKLALTGLAILALQRFAVTVPRLLDGLARNAFAIYFLHIFFFHMLFDYTTLLVPRPPVIAVIVLGLLITAATVAVSWSAAYLIQRALGRYSRLVIGS